MARGAAVNSDGRDALRWLFAMLTLCLLGAASGCAHHPARPMVGRSVIEPPPLEAVYGYWNLRTSRLDELSTAEYDVVRFHFCTFDDAAGGYEEVSGEFYLPQVDQPMPLISVSPILAGAKANYLECRVFGEWAADLGYASFFLYQPERLLEARLSATDIERMLRVWVRSMQKTFTMLLENYSIDESRLGTFGISLGGIRTVLLVATDKRLKANVICLAGGGFHAMLDGSREALVYRYVARRREMLLCDRQSILEDFDRNLTSDPLNVAGAIDPDRVLLVLARLDNKVPIETGWRLHEALGRPELLLSPLGHYTSIFVLPWVMDECHAYYAGKFGAESDPETGE